MIAAWEHFHLQSTTLFKGVLGVAGTFTGIGISLQWIEQWLRIGSLTIGLMVGIVTLLSLRRNWRNKP